MPMIKMHFYASVTLVATTLAVAGCAQDTLPQSSTDDHSGHQVARVTYDCGERGDVTVRYPDDYTAVVPYHDQKHRLHIAPSADGARYAGQDIVWWAKGTGTNAKTTLFHATEGDGTGDKIESCQQITSSRMYETK